MGSPCSCHPRPVASLWTFPSSSSHKYSEKQFGLTPGCSRRTSVELFFLVAHTLKKNSQHNETKQSRTQPCQPNSPNQPSIPGILFHVGSGRVSPSAPRAPGNSSSDVATALAAAHDSSEPHMSLHACSVRCRVRWVSPRAFASASCDKKLLVSVDRLVPTRPATCPDTPGLIIFRFSCLRSGACCHCPRWRFESYDPMETSDASLRCRVSGWPSKEAANCFATWG